MDEKLIELVRSYPGLYDLSHKKYMDYAFKTDIWINIGRELGVEGVICKQRWNNIRDNYRKSLKKPFTKRGKRIKVYKYADELEFLKKSFEDRDNKDKLECQKDATGDEQDSYEEHIQQNEKYYDNPLHDVPSPNIPIVTNEVDDAESSHQSDLQQSLVKRIKLSTRKVTKKRATTTTMTSRTTTRTTATPTDPNYSQQVDTSSSQFMEYLISEKSEEPTPAATTTLSPSSSHHQPPHPVDAFIAGIGASLKTFNPYDLIAAKKEIFDVVQKYEMRMIAVQSDDTNCYQPHQRYSNLSVVAGGGGGGGGVGDIVRVPLLNTSTTQIPNTSWASSNGRDEAEREIQEVTIVKEEK